MPFNKSRFSLAFDKLPDAIDVDDSAGRSVPVNMNFVEEGYLSKDTGTAIAGSPLTEKAHSLFLYQKKNGQRFLIRAYETRLQTYDFVNRVWLEIDDCPVFTADAEFGWAVYNDELWGCNAVEAYFKWNGTTFTEYASAPRGNNLEIFEDRMFVSGVSGEPLTLYYSDTGTPQTFQSASVVRPLGTDYVMTQKNYYGTLMIFKAGSIWKLTFEYNQVVAQFIPKLALQSDSYGAASRKSVYAVENDLWFFTGREVRALGFQDNQIGVLGVNASVISEAIKDTLATIDPANFGVCLAFYENRRFYLAVPLEGETADTMFVCHLLYSNSWTKYSGRDKACATSAAVADEVIYTTYESDTFGVLKWTVTAEDAETFTPELAIN